MRTISIAALLAATLASGALAQTAPAETPSTPPAASPETAPAEKMEPAPAPTAPEATAPTPPAPTAETAPSPTDAPAASTAADETLEVDKLDDLAVVDGNGKDLGEIDDVYLGPGEKHFVTIGHGGFLGLGETKSLVALDQFSWNGQKLVARDISPEALKAMPSFKETAEYRELDDKDLVKVTRQ